jgi:S1-C subfamily serine protease
MGDDRWEEPLSFHSDQFVNVPFSNVQSGVLPVVLHGDGWLRSIGTAFHVGAGLAVTAAHVIEHAIEKESVLREGAGLGVFWTGMLNRSPEREDPIQVPGSLLRVERVSMLDPFDLALLQIQVPFRDGVPLLSAMRLGFQAPGVGTKVAALGYTQYSFSLEAVRLDVAFHATQGTVEEVYWQGQSSMKPFPCFRADARFDPGMSGGPVFAETGTVVGAVCSCMPGGDDEPHTSYSSLLLPLLLMTVANGSGEVDVLSLVQQGHILSDGSVQNATIVKHPDGRQTLAWPSA